MGAGNPRINTKFGQDVCPPHLFPITSPFSAPLSRTPLDPIQCPGITTTAAGDELHASQH